MKYIKPSINNLTPVEYGFTENLKFIERCGRTCYNSLDKMTEDSYQRFYNILIPPHAKDYADFHASVTEHATIYLHINSKNWEDMWLIDFFATNPYSRVMEDDLEGNVKRTIRDLDADGPWYNLDYYITTNWRVILENENRIKQALRGKDVWKYLEIFRVDTPDDHYAIRKTIEVHTGIDISREFNRHRCLSVTESSTRYIDPTTSRHGGEMPFAEFVEYNEDNGYLFNWAFKNSEEEYIKLREAGLKPQIARKVMPLGAATTVIYTAFLDDWNKVLKLRSPKHGAKGVHPDTAEIGDLIYDELLPDLKHYNFVTQ